MNKWKFYGPRSRPFAQLELVHLADIPPLVRREAAAQARWIIERLEQEGEIGQGVDPVRWIQVLATLVLMPAELKTPDGFNLVIGRSWDSVLRTILCGLSSNARRGFPGWRAMLGKDPRYALRATFLKSMRLGWGIHGEERWRAQQTWRALCPELKPAWDEWILGNGPEPDPLGARVSQVCLELGANSEKSQ